MPLSGAHAEDVPPPGISGNPLVALDSTIDVNSFGARSVDVNALVPVGGHLDESGFRARFTGSSSLYRFVASEDPRMIAGGRSLEANLMAGYGLVLPRLSVLVAAGPALVESHDDPGIHRTRRGWKGNLSAYARPTDQTMGYGRVTYSSIGEALELQLKAGVKLLDIGYLGPETKYTTRIGNSEFRFGPHLSGINIGPLALSFSAGWLHDQQLGAGRYFSTSFYLAF
jgi:hypothetical protein